MNKLYFFSCFCFLLSCATTEENPISKTQKTYYLSKGNDTSKVFIEVLNSDKYDFGKVDFGTVVKVAFKFKNASKSVLLIKDATSTCGCTVTKIPPKPILPNGIDSIIVSFDSGKGTKGYQNKVVTLSTNAKNSPHLFTLFGLVQ
jgi:hypothetical protein